MNPNQPDPRYTAVQWLYAAPALVLMALVNVVPILQCVYFADKAHALAGDTRLWFALKHTLAFTAIAVTIELALGLAIALLLFRPFPGRGLVRACVLIPWALPTAIMAMAWKWIFNDTYGVLGDLLYRVGMAASPEIAWLADPVKAMGACVLADVWKTTPFMAILLMSGLAGIPEELYEAAAIDGAGPVRRFFLITLPLLKPTIALAVLFRAIQTFAIFDLIWVLTGGGPGGSTQMIALYVYDTVFRYLDLGYGSTLTLFMAGCLLLISGAIYLLFHTREAYE